MDFWDQKQMYKEFWYQIWLKFLKISLFLFPYYQKSHWNKVWFRAGLIPLNRYFVRSLRVTRSREHLKLYAHLYSSYGYLVNLSISVVLLRAYTLNKCIKMRPRCPPIIILIIIIIIIIIIVIIIIIIIIILSYWDHQHGLQCFPSRIWALTWIRGNSVTLLNYAGQWKISPPYVLVGKPLRLITLWFAN